jgi:hypothetical protein
MPTPTTRQYPLRLPADTYETLRAEAQATDTSINALICALIEAHQRTNRAELIAKIGQAANERYNIVLAKLADL